MIAEEVPRYYPTDNGTAFVDKTPTFRDKPAGIGCGCGSVTVFTSAAAIWPHFKTQRHQRWLKEVNDKRVDMLRENQRLTELVRNQQQIITRQSNEIEMRRLQAETLMQSMAGLVRGPVAAAIAVDDLLDFD